MTGSSTEDFLCRLDIRSELANLVQDHQSSKVSTKSPELLGHNPTFLDLTDYGPTSLIRFLHNHPDVFETFNCVCGRPRTSKFPLQTPPPSSSSTHTAKTLRKGNTVATKLKDNSETEGVESITNDVLTLGQFRKEGSSKLSVSLPVEMIKKHGTKAVRDTLFKITGRCLADSYVEKLGFWTFCEDERPATSDCSGIDSQMLNSGSREQGLQTPKQVEKKTLPGFYSSDFADILDSQEKDSHYSGFTSDEGDLQQVIGDSFEDLSPGRSREQSNRTTRPKEFDRLRDGSIAEVIESDLLFPRNMRGSSSHDGALYYTSDEDHLEGHQLLSDSSGNHSFRHQPGEQTGHSDKKRKFKRRNSVISSDVSRNDSTLAETDSEILGNTTFPTLQEQRMAQFDIASRNRMSKMDVRLTSAQSHSHQRRLSRFSERSAVEQAATRRHRKTVSRGEAHPSSPSRQSLRTPSLVESFVGINVPSSLSFPLSGQLKRSLLPLSKPVSMISSSMDQLPLQLNYEEFLCKAKDSGQEISGLDRTPANSGRYRSIVPSSNRSADPLLSIPRCSHRRQSSVVERRFRYPARRQPPECLLSQSGTGWPRRNLPSEVLAEILSYCSFRDMKSLRLVCTKLAVQLAWPRFRSCTVKFGPNLYENGTTDWNRMPHPNSILSIHGNKIYRFGVALELDYYGLVNARPKDNHVKVDSFWGSYDWPLEFYPRFKNLKNLETLADNVTLMKNALRKISQVGELGLSLDSGHGWLAGPDQSDMALYQSRCGGSEVLKPEFPVEDTNSRSGKAILFENAQRRSCQIARRLMPNSEQQRKLYCDYVIRPLRSFRKSSPSRQEDDEQHTGGVASQAFTDPRTRQQIIAAAMNAPGFANTNLQYAGLVAAMNATGPANVNFPNTGFTTQHNFTSQLFNSSRNSGLLNTNPSSAQDGPSDRRKKFPLIFDSLDYGHPALMDGNALLPDVTTYPFKASKITEPQAQWLLETAWAQRAFLSSYVAAILANSDILSKQVRRLHIGKISTNLLKGLENAEFWRSFKRLEDVTIMLIPDWRQELIPGDIQLKTGKQISPVLSSIKFRNFLSEFVVPIQTLSRLTIGFYGGGEHASGLMARNNHVLPAPLSTYPKFWLINDAAAPDPSNLLFFDHVEHLTFRNCWFSPLMLQSFMHGSRDTSLKTLTLDSVSLTTMHSSHSSFHATSLDANRFQPIHDPSAWLHEKLPTRLCWPALLDSITPGETFTERKVRDGLIFPSEVPSSTIPDNETSEDAETPDKDFRGNIDKIILKSCGYVYITGGVSREIFNQSDLVWPNFSPTPPVLCRRREMMAELALGTLNEIGGSGNPLHADDDLTTGPANNNTPPPLPPTPSPAGLRHPSHGNGAAMPIPTLAGGLPEGTWPLLGMLTQCIHPIEKRVLEGAWGCVFGWGDDEERWRSVEDGWFEGGTGRFSGVVGRGGLGEGGEKIQVGRRE
ncbi:MAG: hypothetical protein Q9227_000624 [Pyrenula ochraceoflavens]